MPTKLVTPVTPSIRTFPAGEVEQRLREDLQSAAADSSVLRGGWEPELDSLQMVSVCLSLEDLFDFDLPPEQMVRKGGYRSVEEALSDMTARLRQLWDKHQ